MPYIIGVILILSIGIGIGWSLAPESSSHTIETVSDSSQSVDATNIKEINSKLNDLVLQLENERQARKHLQQSLAQLRQDLKKTGIENLSEDITEALPDETTVSDPASAANVASAQMNQFGVQNVSDREQALLSVGLDNADIDKIDKRIEQQEMQQLYLQNKARREGWYGTQRYFEESRNLSSNSNIYREELGDDRYDRYLYESGQNNRVLVQSVISGSPAEQVGLIEGDVIYRYGDKRIFGWNDLTSATAEGDPSQVIRIEIKRKDQSLEFYVKRGPLGIRLGSDRVNP